MQASAQNTKNLDWVTKKANLLDRDAILQLLREGFRDYWSATQSAYSREFWDWLYCDNPSGGSITYVAESGGRIVGHFPNVLGYIKVNDKVHLSGTVIHLVTHSDYRGRGIFKKLGELSLEDLSRSNIPFSLAFPNDKSYPGFIKNLGFSSIMTLPLLFRPLRINNMLAGMTKRPTLAFLLSLVLCPAYHALFHNYRIWPKYRDIEIKPIEDFGAEFDAFWEKASGQADVMTLRNAKFLNWRFKARPNQKYYALVALRNGELTGYMVTRKAEMFSIKTGVIMDYLALPGAVDAFYALLERVLDDFKKEGLDLGIAACVENNMYYKALKEWGFVKLPSRINPRKLVLVGRANACANSVDKRIFLDKRNWFVNFSDWDVF